MNSTEIALIVFACVFGGALLGMLLRVVMPEHHLSEDSKDVIKLGMGLIATIAALVLGLVIATAKSSYDTQDAAIKHTAAKILLLDHMLATYGPETKEIRDEIRRILVRRIDQIWPEERSQPAKVDPPAASPAAGGIQGDILKLVPQNEAQRWLQIRALKIADQIMETRLFVTGGLGSSVPAPFLIVVVFWLTFIFGCFGIFAARNTTVLVVLFICALSVAGSIFLILEMDQPFRGIMKISSTPLRYTLSHLGQ
ncbi:MAG: hypothetical protein ABSG91_05085 [Syntrophobacteraceae bacterium]